MGGSKKTVVNQVNQSDQDVLNIQTYQEYVTQKIRVGGIYGFKYIFYTKEFNLLVTNLLNTTKQWILESPKDISKKQIFWYLLKNFNTKDPEYIKLKHSCTEFVLSDLIDFIKTSKDPKAMHWISEILSLCILEGYMPDPSILKKLNHLIQSKDLETSTHDALFFAVYLLIKNKGFSNQEEMVKRFGRLILSKTSQDAPVSDQFPLFLMFLNLDTEKLLSFFNTLCQKGVDSQKIYKDYKLRGLIINIIDNIKNNRGDKALLCFQDLSKEFTYLLQEASKAFKTEGKEPYPYSTIQKGLSLYEKMGMFFEGRNRDSFNEILAKMKEELLKAGPVFLYDLQPPEGFLPNKAITAILPKSKPMEVKKLFYFKNLPLEEKTEHWTQLLKSLVKMPPAREKYKAYCIAVSELLENQFWLNNNSTNTEELEALRQKLIQHFLNSLPKDSVVTENKSFSHCIFLYLQDLRKSIEKGDFKNEEEGWWRLEAFLKKTAEAYDIKREYLTILWDLLQRKNINLGAYLNNPVFQNAIDTLPQFFGNKRALREQQNFLDFFMDNLMKTLDLVRERKAEIVDYVHCQTELLHYLLFYEKIQSTIKPIKEKSSQSARLFARIRELDIAEFKGILDQIDKAIAQIFGEKPRKPKKLKALSSWDFEDFSLGNSEEEEEEEEAFKESKEFVSDSDEEQRAYIPAVKYDANRWNHLILTEDYQSMVRELKGRSFSDIAGILQKFRTKKNFEKIVIELAKHFRKENCFDKSLDILNWSRTQSESPKILIAISQELKYRGDRSKALQLLLYIQAEFPTERAVTRYLGHWYFDEHQYLDAVHYYKRALQLYNNNIYPHLDLARCYTEMGLFDQSIVVLNSILKWNIEPEQVLLKLSEAYLKMGDYTNAINYCMKIDRWETKTLVLLHLADIYKKNGEFSKAQESIFKISDYKSDKKAMLSLIDLYSKMEYTSSFEQILRHLSIFLPHDPEVYMLCLRRLLKLRHNLKNPDLCRDIEFPPIKKMIERYPSNKALKVLEAKILRYRGDYIKAEKILQDILSLDPNNQFADVEFLYINARRNKSDFKKQMETCRNKYKFVNTLQSRLNEIYTQCKLEQPIISQQRVMLTPEIKEIFSHFSKINGSVYLVGGKLISLLRKVQKDSDIDFVIFAAIEDLQDVFNELGIQKCKHIPNLYTGVINGHKIDIMVQNPCNPSTDPYLDDLLGRDFRAFSLLCNEEGYLTDPTGMGIADAMEQVLETNIDPGVSFKKDPVRLLRAMQKLTEGFKLSKRVAEAIYSWQPSVMSLKDLAHILAVAKERSESANFMKFVDNLIQYGLLEKIFGLKPSENLGESAARLKEMLFTSKTTSSRFGLFQKPSNEHKPQYPISEKWEKNRNGVVTQESAGRRVFTGLTAGDNSRFFYTRKSNEQRGLIRRHTI